MRYLRHYGFGLIAISLIVVALANRGAVRLTLLPDALGELVGFNVQLQVPLFRGYFPWRDPGPFDWLSFGSGCGR